MRSPGLGSGNKHGEMVDITVQYVHSCDISGHTHFSKAKQHTTMNNKYDNNNNNNKKNTKN